MGRPASEERDALMAQALRQSADRDRFWAKVDRSGECWIWKGATNDSGYGVFTIKRKPVIATRFALAIALYRVPVGDVLHSCDTPACVRPRHLREGSQVENNGDMVKRGRQVRGTKHGRSRVAVALRKQIAAAPGSAREVAKQFGVTAPVVFRARKQFPNPAAQEIR